MICSRRLYKGNTYEICLPLTDTGVTLVRFYTRGDVIIEKAPEITGDSMCFSFTEEDLASLEDGVLRYEIVTEYETTDTNSQYVIATPGDYSGSTLDDLLEDAFDSGYTAGQEDCSGGSCEHVWEEGYDSGYTDGSESVDCTPYYDSGYTSGYTDGRGSVDCSPFYDSGVTDGYASGYTSGHTDGFEEGYASGTTDGWQPAYDSGFTDGVNSVECSGYTQEDLDNAYSSGWSVGYGSGYTDGLADCSGVTPVVATSLTWYSFDQCGRRNDNSVDIDSLSHSFPTYIASNPSGAVLDMVYASSDPSVISIDASGNVIGHQSWTPVTLSATDLNSNITVTMDELEATPTPYTVNRALSDCPCGVALDGSYDSTSCSCVPVSGGTYHQELDFVAPSWANSTEIRMVSKPSWVSYVTPSAWTKCVSGEVQNIEFTVDECYDASPLSGDYRHGEIVFQENGVSAMTNQIDIYQYKPE